MPLKKAYAYTSKMMTINMMAMDVKEGISAFLEKENQRKKIKRKTLYLFYNFGLFNFNLEIIIKKELSMMYCR